MKRLLPVLACCIARIAAAQMMPSAQSSAPTPDEPQNVNVKSDGRCVTVRPGDTVHYSLTIEGVGGAHAILGDLRLRLGHSRELMHGGLPAPDFRSLGGGGLGTHDNSEGKVYHFAFKVPKELYGGTYRGVEVNVSADEPPPQSQALYRPVGERAPRVDVTRHTRDEVHAYCLNVISNFGAPQTRPAVTNFSPGPVDAPSPVLAPPQPAPLPR